MWTSDHRLYLNESGQVVEADDPTRATLLVCAGGRIPLAQAKALGLVKPVAEIPIPIAEVSDPEIVTTPSEPVTEEKAEDPAEDKAVKPASDKAVKPDRNKSKK